ncbi:MAG: hypothetical protein B7Y39_06740 [Bdellovibrio sp. 28-41-41]|nr:MAG: hypothetical protein B7Y39_06740 [Bdellovibrio sp. 28-41-41]
MKFALIKHAVLALIFAVVVTLQMGCSKGVYLGPESAEFLATASQEDCGYLQNEYGQRVAWKENLPAEFFVSKTIPEEFRQDIADAAEIWNTSAGRTVLKINLSDLESPLSTSDQRNTVAGLQDWDEDKTTQQAVTIVKFRGNLITSADIKINLDDFVYYSKEPQNSKQVHFVSLIVHELGHALGLKHASIRPTVMWATLGFDIVRTSLSATDQKSLECEY